MHNLKENGGKKISSFFHIWWLTQDIHTMQVKSCQTATGYGGWGEEAHSITPAVENLILLVYSRSAALLLHYNILLFNNVTKHFCQ